ncbi:MAG: 1-acyl-sn-glycerol-3-phosphate acyltransferase [Malacoplasma sp.]|nr:1-acyl-sn-glycerol-3-phosphate acyltransferase [Malacoplasma sp.]
MKKFFFKLGHSLGFVFVLLFLFFSLMKSKKKYEEWEDENEVMSLDDRYDYVYGMVKKAVFCTFTKIKIKGKENIPTNKPVMFVPNHKSNFDVLVLLKTFSMLRKNNSGILNPTFLSKIEISKTKKISYAAKLINTIFIDRGNLRDLVRVIKEEKELLQKGEQSLIMFIEGTRIKSHELGEFKAAALTPAYSTFCQIVPVVIYGTLGVEKEHKKNILKYKEVTVQFLNPIKYKDYIQLSKDLIADKMKAKMQEAYNEIKENPNWKEEKEK